ncbi:MAG: hypothetical protein A4E36_00780 [Methanoregulaceae archaeon PtaB.Bin009]|nr:MAG: hypothetical protein A4E36_00780 [Methanoregulaceae archaeon PtaB.Bin009]
MSCVEMMTVFPCWFSSSRSSMMSSDPDGSRPLVGSSNTSTSGSIASTPAMATRFFSPPDRWWGGRRPNPERPTRPRAPSTASFTSSSVNPRLVGPNATSWYTVGEMICRSGFWSTNPTLFRSVLRDARSYEMGTLSKRMVPESGRIMPLNIRRIVDFPAPFGPTSAIFSPLRTWKLIPRIASIPLG